MPKFSLKYIIPRVSLVVILVILLTLYVVKPGFVNSSVKSSQISYPDTISLSNQDFKLEFTELQQIFINGKKVATSKSYTLKSGDLVEGENTIEVKGVSDYYFASFVASQSTTKTIQVDRVGPKIALEKDLSKFVLLEDKISLNLNSDSAGKLVVGQQEFDLKQGLNEVTVNLVDGENELSLVAKDEVGNQSEAIKKTLNAFIKPGWEKYFCAGLFLPINTNTLQRGYSDIGFYGITSSGAKLSKPSTEQQIYLKQSRDGDCDKPNPNTKSFYLGIYPKGTKIDCYPCGSSALPYISIYAKAIDSGGIGRPWEVVKTQEFTTKSGVTGKLSDYKSEGMQAPGDFIETMNIREFNFKANGYNYFLWMVKQISTLDNTVDINTYYKNLDSDFEEILNNFVVMLKEV